MVTPIDPATAALVERALDAASLRQQVHASNIASAGTPGHHAQRVNFEDSLGAVRDELHGGRLAAATVRDSAPAEVVAAPQAEVQLDQEVAAMSHNAMHYQALVRLLNKQLAVFGAALDGGRR
ncbi:flagellar basal body rod protein FlgB [Methylibium rhizosphaerae]|uniref:flagellar basal body rod protein FlgB n=1 Tax=Methylibium rhizosphaerae TaxID=2570323 RepID=UPI00112D5315|nr:flagellar basal body protein [Methylibium rhizosphaerae]